MSVIFNEGGAYDDGSTPPAASTPTTPAPTAPVATAPGGPKLAEGRPIAEAAPTAVTPTAPSNAFTDSLAGLAQSQAARAKNVFQPLEDQAVQSVQQFQSPEFANEQAALAEGNVRTKFADQKKQAEASLASLGVNPADGRFSGMKRGLAAAEGLGEAAAGTQSRQSTRQLAYDTLTGLSARGATNVNQAIQAGQAGGSTYNTAVGNANTAQGLANQFYLGSQNVGNSAADIENRKIQGQQQQDDQASAGFGSLVGSILGIGKFLSSKKAKTERKLATGSLDAVDKMPVESYKYKRELGDPNTHVGPMAEDMQEATGMGDGKTISAQDLAGVTLGAVQELHKKVRRLENRHA